VCVRVVRAVKVWYIRCFFEASVKSDVPLPLLFAHCLRRGQFVFDRDLREDDSRSFIRESPPPLTPPPPAKACVEWFPQLADVRTFWEFAVPP